MRYFVGGVLGFFMLLVWAAFPGCITIKEEPEVTEGAAIALQFSELVRGICTQQEPNTGNVLLYELHRDVNRFAAPHGVGIRVDCR